MFSEAPCRPTVAVSDKEKAKAFYGDTLGLPLHDAGFIARGLEVDRSRDAVRIPARLTGVE